MSKPDLSGYVEVGDRISAFREKHPEGSFQVRIVDVPKPFNEQFIAVEARAYRSPDDKRPGIDIAWEPVPGKTPYTKDSEAMNASTSAVGRAIVYALAADAHTGIASANEVRSRASSKATAPKAQTQRQAAQVPDLTDIELALNAAGLAPDTARSKVAAYMVAELEPKRVVSAMQQLTGEQQVQAKTLKTLKTLTEKHLGEPLPVGADDDGSDVPF